MRVVTGFTGPWTRTNGVSWLKLLVIILVLRWAFFELYSIPSGSMEPVLHGDPRYFHGDRVAVNKALFGPRIPFTTIRIFPLGKPDRWDIVVFNNVDPDAEHATLIKRVVGLPGEHVRILNGQIHVNKEPIEPPEELKDIPTVCGSLRQALTALEEDRDFLLQGGVFSDDQIDAYLELKWEEIYAFEHAPHPVEFSLYYSV